ncbi:MAG: transporter ATP-binding protein, partial [Actinomycetia bacterium]|nr:transporter ATP-binding protein [Actinomycetes bacterium]
MLIRLLRTYLRPYRKPLAFLLVLQFAQTVATLYLPTLNADIIDNGVIFHNTHYILTTGAVMLAITFAQVVCATGAVYFGARIAMALGRDVRQAVFGRVLMFSDREVNRLGTASLITRTTHDGQQVQMLVILTFAMLLIAPIMCVGGIILALNQNVPLSSVLLVAVPVAGVIMALIVVRMRPLFRQMQERLDGINQVLREQITGVRVIRAFVRDPQERERFGRASTQLFDVSLGAGNLVALMFPSLLLVLDLSTTAVVWFGGHMVADGTLQIGSLIAFITYLAQILTAVMMATFMFILVPRADVSAERIMEVIETEPGVAASASPLPAGPQPGRLELRDVEFRYPGAEQSVLRDISLTALPGRTTAIIGGTGSGKTTLVNLIPRLIDVTGGSLLVGGVDVRELDPAALSAAVGLVPQRPYLFSGTVATNLRYGSQQATDEDLWRALEIAQARDFVERMPG